MKTLWTFGCSFTQPYFDMINHDGSEGHYTKYRKYCGGTFPKTWSELLSDKIDYKLENHGRGGGSCYWSFHRFCEQSHNIQEGDVVIFQWSHIERFIIAQNGNELLNISGPWQFDSAGDLSSRTVEEIYVNRTQIAWIEEINNYMKLMDRLAELGKFKIFYWSACDSIINGESEEFRNQDKFLLNECNRDMIRYLQTKYEGLTIAQETKEEVPDAHYGRYGHQVLCDLFYNDITSKIQL